MRSEYRPTLGNRKWMLQKYQEEFKTATEIAAIIGCATPTVTRVLRKYGVEIRGESKPTESRECPTCKNRFVVGGRQGRPRSAVYCSRHCHMLQQSPRCTASEAPRPRKNINTLHNKDWIFGKYVTSNMSMGEIGILCNCHSSSVRSALLKFGIAIRPLSEAMFGRKLKRHNPEEDITKIKPSPHQKLKAEMIEAYGGCCECCGEKELTFLCLDHIYGEGLEERTRIGGSAALYRYLQKLGWPKGKHRILCANCNQATKFGKPCPHQLGK